jgi:hypothetical protein
MNTLFGKRVILFPFEPSDYTYFDKLRSNGNRARMFEFLEVENLQDNLYEGMENGNFSMWISKTNQGKASEPVGIVFVAHINEHLHGMKFIPDAKFLKGLSKFLKKDKMTYIEDTLQTVLAEFEDKVRLEIKLPARDVLLSTLIQRNGFKREGTLQSYALIDDEYVDISIFARIKKEE